MHRSVGAAQRCAVADVARGFVAPLASAGETKMNAVTQNVLVQQLRAVCASVYGDEQPQRATTKEQQ